MGFGGAACGLTGLDTAVKAGYHANITITNPPTTLQLSKAWGTNSVATNVANIGATTGGSANTVAFTSTAPTAASSAVVTVAVGNTITFPAETMSSGTLSNYTTTLSCLAGGGATANALSGTNGQVANTLVIGAGDTSKAIVCTYTNNKRPTVTLTKVSQGGIGTFTFTGDNGWTSQNITTATAGVGVTGTLQRLTNVSTATTITESALPAGYTMTNVSCTGMGAGGTVTPNYSAGTFAFNAAATAAGSDIACTVTNTKTPTVKIQKTTTGGFGGPFSFAQTNLASTPSNITTTVASTATPTTPTAINVSTIGTAVTLTETPAAGFLISTATCTDANSAITGNTGSAFATLSGNVLTIPALNVKAGADFTCVFTNVRRPTITLTKISNGGVGGSRYYA